MNQQSTPPLFIRITDTGIMLASDNPDNEGPWFEPQITRNGISPAANMRMVLKNKPNLTQEYDNVLVTVDVPTLLMPEEDFNEEGLEEAYKSVYTTSDSIIIEHSQIESLKAVSAYGMNKDLKSVLTENFKHVQITPLMHKTWEYLNTRSQGRNAEKVYVYMHEGKMEVCSFIRNRFQFCNSFNIVDIHDALYFILGVWKHLGYSNVNGELFLVGTHEEWDWLANETRKFIPHTYQINPAADFNRAPVTSIEGIPFDLLLQFVY